MNRIKYCVAGSLLAASMLALTGCGSYDVNIRVEPIPAEEVADNMNTIRIHVDADDVGVSVDNGIEVSAGTFAETAEAKEGVSDETLSEAPTLECTPYYYCEDANCEGHTNPDDTCKTATEETEYVDDEEIDYYNLYLTYDRFEDGKLYFIDDGADVDVEFVVALENILGDIEYMEAGDSVLICFNGKFINSNDDVTPIADATYMALGNGVLYLISSSYDENWKEVNTYTMMDLSTGTQYRFINGHDIESPCAIGVDPITGLVLITSRKKYPNAEGVPTVSYTKDGYVACYTPIGDFITKLDCGVNPGAMLFKSHTETRMFQN